MQSGCRRAVICLEGRCDILRKWLFLFDQRSAHVTAWGDGDEEAQILSSAEEDLGHLGRKVPHRYHLASEEAINK